MTFLSHSWRRCKPQPKLSLWDIGKRDIHSEEDISIKADAFENNGFPCVAAIYRFCVYEGPHCPSKMFQHLWDGALWEMESALMDMCEGPVHNPLFFSIRKGTYVLYRKFALRDDRVIVKKGIH